MIHFCGYPVPYNFLLHGAPRNLTLDFEPCGKLATPGHAFCDEHGKLFEQENIPLTEQDIVDRAAAARPSPRYVRNSLLFLVITLAIAVSVPAVHEYLVRHREVILGILAGSLAQTGIIYLSRWAWDRWRWLKWFSHQ